ncbi:MAG: HAD family phosphatase [Bacteroidaceae bacterium]
MSDLHSIAALFDLDGVVIDTESQYTLLWEQIGKDYFPEISGFAHLIKGMTLVQIHQKYFLDKPNEYEEAKQKLEAFELQMTYEFIPGVETFLTALRAAGIQTAVVTSSDRKKMKRVYDVQPRLKSYFDRIFMAEHFAHSKPDPDCYLLGAKEFGLPLSQCVVFEDSINGLKAGVAAQMVVVGLTTTHPEAIVSQYSNLVIPDFENFNIEKMQALLSL